MSLFSQMAPSLPFFLQKVRNSHNYATIDELNIKDLNIMFTIIYGKKLFFSESKTIDVHCPRCLFHLFKHFLLGKMRQK